MAREWGPLVHYPAGPVHLYLGTSPEVVQHVLVSNQANYTKDTFQYRLLARITGQGLLTTDGPVWLRRRRLAQPSFQRARVESFAPLFLRAAHRTAERWSRFASEDRTVDVAREMMLVALQAVMDALFGAEVEDEADALAVATLDVLHHIMADARTLGMLPSWAPTARNRRFKSAMAVLDGAIYGTLEARRSGTDTQDDLLGRLMAARVDGEALSDQELRDEMLTLLIAGHETVASALAWAWHLLAVEPEADRRLEAELTELPEARVTEPDGWRDFRFTGAIFEEALRLYPPAWMVTRTASQADEVAGFQLPAGALVVLSPYVTQRDPELWPEPDAFRPDRFLQRDPERPRYAYFPFGGGPHLCIGSHFSAVEAVVLLSTLARRFRVVHAGDPRPKVDPGVTLQPKGGLPMRIERR